MGLIQANLMPLRGEPLNWMLPRVETESCSPSGAINHPIPSYLRIIWVSPDIVFALAVAYFIIFLPLAPGFKRMLSWYEDIALRRSLELATAYVLFVFVITPDKATIYPEDIPDRYLKRSINEERRPTDYENLIPLYKGTAYPMWMAGDHVGTQRRSSSKSFR